jgi:hypothetical protein
MKRIILTALFVLSAATAAFAAPSVPDAKVWVTPTDAKPTEEVTLNAFVYNTEKQDITFTVSFTAASKEIASATLLIPAETAKVATAIWAMPEKSTVVTATVTKAVTKQSKDLTAFHGKLGTVTVGTTTPLSKITIPGQETVKGWFGSLMLNLEAYRARQEKHFAEARDAAKEKLGLTVKDAAKELLSPEVPAPLSQGEEVKPVQEKNDPLDYATLIYSTLLSSFFANKPVFYIVLIILVLFVIRFIVGRFS